MTVKRREVQPIYENTFHRRHHRRWWVLLGLIVVALIAGFGWTQWQAHQKRQLANYPIRGVTVNQDSGYLDYQQLAKHVQFVYLQATSGATYTDDDFSDNYSRSQGASVKVGVAHTFSFTTSANRQYRHFHTTVGQNTGTLPIMVAVNYYGKYNSSNVDMAKQGQKLKKLVSELEWYHQGVIILATQQVLTQFVRPVLPAQDYWVTGGKLAGHSAQVKLIAYDTDGSVTQNGQSLPVVRSVFNGNQHAWQKFAAN
ncbi:MAG: Lyzozyme M1 (1,4-beta-N-acetylmuramidase) [Levilactobacillus sp.]|uniref:GH25 family lysozyme n=1 Tax=Levilactobacillus sp. TaxID=2767919 RepID=UPI00258CB8DF|nr:GH25 family lysozyme [Levilactobacillus sp.]MCH4123881.1 Lyzozyme M1 (1,4-beta-N-acetylmuramidase) [Levilactobacillus sp.]MCI1553979.1 Lyzozyme M1 (1,4-beta-N-acetylmuramidase) [Levilactobacillus sp.]